MQSISTRKFLSLFTLMILNLHSINADEVTHASAYFSPADYQLARLSPDGEHLAVTANIDGDAHLIIFEVTSMKPVAMFKSQRYQKIENFWWANSERVIFDQSTTRGFLDYGIPTGELFAINIDNSQKFPLAGYRAGDTTGAYTLLNTMPEDPDRVRVIRWQIRKGRTAKSRPVAYTLNIYKRSGTRRGTHLKPRNLDDRLTSPFPWGGFIADNQGEPRMAWYIDEKGVSKVSLRGADDSWQEMDSLSGSEDNLLPGIEDFIVSFDAESDGVYYLANGQFNTAALYHLDLKTKQQRVIYEHKDFDINAGDLIFNSNRRLIGVNLLGTYPEQHFFLTTLKYRCSNPLMTVFPISE